MNGHQTLPEPTRADLGLETTPPVPSEPTWPDEPHSASVARESGHPGVGPVTDVPRRYLTPWDDGYVDVPMRDVNPGRQAYADPPPLEGWPPE